MNSTAEHAVEKLIDMMKKSRESDSKRIYLLKIPPDQYKKIREQLIKEKFVEFEDFLSIDEIFAVPDVNLPSSNMFLRQM